MSAAASLRKRPTPNKTSPARKRQRTNTQDNSKQNVLMTPSASHNHPGGVRGTLIPVHVSQPVTNEKWDSSSSDED